MNWLMKDEYGRPLSNFSARVISVDDIFRDAEKMSIPHIRFSLDFGDDSREHAKEFCLPSTDIDGMNWRTLDMRCCYAPSVSETKVERYINMYLHQQLEKVPRRTIYRFSHAGMYIIEGKPVFCTGSDVIRGNGFASDILFETDLMMQKLEVDANLSEAQSAVEFFRLLSLSPDPARIILAYKLGFFMRPVYENIGNAPKGCIYIYGRSGIQKTTYSSFLVQTYDRSSGIKSPSRLNASIPAAVNLLMENTNDVVVMDDLFPADSKGIKGKQEEILIEITRYIADGTIPARMKGKELSQGYPQCGVIFTGEYLIGRGSDAARLLPVEMTKPDVEKLRYFQEHPLIVSTFYRHYITWFIEHYDDVHDILQQLRYKYENLSLNVHDRLKEMYFFLGSSYFLFLQYLYDKEFISESDAARLYQAFNELLVTLVKQQDGRVWEKQSEEYTSEDYLKRLSILYTTGQMSIASGVAQFDKELHDGLMHRSRLYLRSDKLLEYFPGIILKDIVDSLEKKGVLEAGKNSRTKQISRLNGMRFYVIKL